jgi:tol-pal system protein YbgF
MNIPFAIKAAPLLQFASRAHVRTGTLRALGFIAPRRKFDGFGYKQALLVTLLAIFMAAPAAMGAAPVSDPSAERLDRLENQTQTTLDLAEQVRLLQEEVQTLRGMVEVNDHQISQLTERQRDFYTDLDSRINELKNAMPPASSSPAPSPGQGAGQVSGSVNQEYIQYQQAYDLMQQKRYGEAIAAFEQYVVDHPNGKYAANSYYWMGETQIIHSDLNAAKASFQKIVTQFPTHQKSADALLKLGYVYDAAGQKDKALKTLTEVKTKYPGSSVALKAEQRINQIKKRG